MRYQVGIQATPIFADGVGDSYTLYNDGPWTIYLDNDSSVGETSYPLAPTATVVWDALRPLFAVCPGKEVGSPTETLPVASFLFATRNSGMADANRATVFQRLFRTVSSTVGAVSSDYTLPTIETSSFNSLQFFLEGGDGFLALATGDVIRFSFSWYDRDGNQVNKSEAYAFNRSGSRVVTVPVQGYYVSTVITYFAEPATPITVNVYGTDRVLDYGIAQFGTQGILALTNTAGMNLLATSTDDAVVWSSSALVLGETVYISNRGPYLTIGIRLSSAATGVGRYVIQSGLTANAIFGTLEIPVGAQRLEQTFNVPLFHPLSLIATAPTGPASASLALAWTQAS